MRIDLPPLDFRTHRFICVSADPFYQDADLQICKALEQRCQDERLSVLTAGIARDTTLQRWVGWSSVPEEWLARDAAISRADAQRIIAGFPIKISHRLKCLAMNPCRFLGVVSAIARLPDVVIYETSGMDPLGVKAIHDYLFSVASGPGMIHVSAARECGFCKSDSQCLSVSVSTTFA